MIDTHQHLIYPDRFGYTWTRNLPALQGSFRIEEYRVAAAGCGIEGAIFMEVDVDEGESIEESRFFCDLAGDPSSGILGVIAAAQPGAAGFAQHLEALEHPKLKGIRRVLHTQVDAVSQTDGFRADVARLGRHGLTFDICVLQRQLGLALDLVRSCPGTVFILDHCGVPDIAHNAAPHGEGFLAWRRAVGALAAEPNVHGKISGLTTYAAEGQRTEDGLRCYVDTMLESFGPERLVWGGDWPVVNLGSGLARWCALTRKMLDGLSAEERVKIFSANARVLYKLT
jgi:predicted TIM-barrel fold metal-dependent hydrolase